MKLPNLLALVFALLAGVGSQQTYESTPAYHDYQELLKVNDTVVKGAPYACFYDDPKRSRLFFIIGVTWSGNKNDTLLVSRRDYKNGYASDRIKLFQGKVEASSGKTGVFATLPTLIAQKNSVSSAHHTDVFEWSPEVLSMKSGFGPTPAGKARDTFEFKMQRSTGRFTEDSDVAKKPNAVQVSSPGTCVRVPGSRTPEEML